MKYDNSPALSSQVCTTSLLTVVVFIICAKLVAWKSPVRELTMTPLRSILARTVVNLTLHSLGKRVHVKLTPKHTTRAYAPLFLDHFKKIAMIHDALKDRPEGKPVVPTEGSREP